MPPRAEEEEDRAGAAADRGPGAGPCLPARGGGRGGPGPGPARRPAPRAGEGTPRPPLKPTREGRLCESTRRVDVKSVQKSFQNLLVLERESRTEDPGRTGTPQRISNGFRRVTLRRDPAPSCKARGTRTSGIRRRESLLPVGGCISFVEKNATMPAPHCPAGRRSPPPPHRTRTTGGPLAARETFAASPHAWTPAGAPQRRPSHRCPYYYYRRYYCLCRCVHAENRAQLAAAPPDAARRTRAPGAPTPQAARLISGCGGPG